MVNRYWLHCSAIADATPVNVLLASFALCATPRLPPLPLENPLVLEGKNGLYSETTLVGVSGGKPLSHSSVRLEYG